MGDQLTAGAFLQCASHTHPVIDVMKDFPLPGKIQINICHKC